MSRNVRKVAILAAMVIAGFGIAEPCYARAQQETTAIRFGTLPAESAIPLIIAHDRGMFRDEGVDVQLVPFNAPTDRNVAAQAGQIDGFIADVMTAISLNQAGFPVRITSDINEDFKVLTAPKSGIDTFAALNGKDVSLVPNFVLEYIMDVLAARNGISYHTVVIPSISARFEALLAGKISAVVFTEPQASLLEASGAHLLADSREAGISAGAILFTDRSVASKPESIRRFYRGLNRAIGYASGRSLKEFAPMMNAYGFPENVTDALRGSLDFDLPRAVPDATFESVVDWMKTKKTLQTPTSLTAVSDFSFLQ